MGSNVKISYEKFSNMLSQFEDEINELEEIFSDMKAKTKVFAEYWEGNDSDEVLPNLEKVENDFENINTHNKQYLEYLQRVLELYKNYESSISKVVKEGDQSLDINAV